MADFKRCLIGLWQLPMLRLARSSTGRRAASYLAFHAGRAVRAHGPRLLGKALARIRARRRGRPAVARRSNRRGASMMPGIGFKRQVFNFKLCHTINMVGDASSVTEDSVVALSDPTDVQVAQATVQPTGWEERAAFYSKAKVLSASVNVRFEKTSTDANPMVFGLLANTDATVIAPSTIWTNWCEYPRTQIRHLVGTGAANAAVHNRIVNMRYHTKPFKHFAEGLRNTANEILLPDTSPSNIVYLHILMSAGSQAAMSTTTKATAVLTYRWKVLMYDRRNLTKSTDT